MIGDPSCAQSQTISAETPRPRSAMLPLSIKGFDMPQIAKIGDTQCLVATINYAEVTFCVAPGGGAGYAVKIRLEDGTEASATNEAGSPLTINSASCVRAAGGPIYSISVDGGGPFDASVFAYYVIP